MKLLAVCIAFMAVTFNVSIGQIQTLDDYISKSWEYETSGKIEDAVKLMEEAITKYPDDSTAYSYLGLYLGMQAGRTTDMMEASNLIGRSFEMLDKAVLLDPNNPMARFHRGLLGVNVPLFLGKMETGIKDLEYLIELSQQTEVSNDILVTGYEYLAQVYQKGGEKQKAESAWKKVLELAPGTNLAKEAEENLKKLSEAEQPEKQVESPAIDDLKQKIEGEPDNPKLLLELGRAYADAKDFGKAREALEKAVKMDPNNIEAYKSLASVIGELASKGYDEMIHEDTNYRTNLAFDIARVLDKAVELAPEDVELRLQRGIIGVSMPFFVGKLDQGMDDLNRVLKSNADNSAKAEALYWLGMAHQKRTMTYWIKVVSDYPETKSSHTVFETMRPGVKRINLSEYKLPILTVDFILGFRDELPPQTAVWVEDKNGKFVKTIYVSGFSGHAREKQINLPEWSESSKFSDVDGVTGASIDLGHHIYVWDLKDLSGKVVEPGEYVIKVEVAYWPSTQYQLASVNINLGKKKERSTVEKGDLIPFLGVEYYPEVNNF